MRILVCNIEGANMPNLRQMNYTEFGKLRFLDYFPKTSAYQKGDDGGVECGIGSGCVEGYLICTGFASPEGSNMQTAEITLDFESPVSKGGASERQRALEA